MNRRSFFGAAAGAVAAAPAIGSAAVQAAPKMHSLKLAFDGSAVAEAIEPLKYVAGVSRSFQFDPSTCGYPTGRDRYVYRTGFPSIDALRSISGVHKARMEHRNVENGCKW